MNIDKYKLPSGEYFSEEAGHCDSAQEFILQSFNLCGCGSPEECLAYIRDVLKLQSELSSVVYAASDRLGPNSKEYKAVYDSWKAEGEALMGRSYYYTLYCLTRDDLLEHGGSVGGSWLTDKGAMLLADLNELLKEDES